MGRLKLTIIGGIAGLALAVPATAAAAPDVKDVREQAQKARAFLDYSTWAAELGNPGHAEHAFDRFERKAQRALRMSRRIDRPRHRAQVSAKARAMRVVGRTNDLALDRFAEVLDEVPVDVQPLVADIIGSSAEARERVVEILTRLAERLPEPARTKVLDAIASFSADGDVEALLEAVTGDEVIDSVKVIVTGHLEDITEHLDSVLDRLEDLTAQLPAPAREAVAMAIAMIRSQLDGLSDMIGGILDSLPGLPGLPDLPGAPGGGELPLPDAVTGGLCDLLGGLPIPVPIPIICD